MVMTAKIKLRDVDDLVISSASITSKHYEYSLDPEEFLNKAWNVADKMAHHLACSDEWCLSLTFELDLRETFEEALAKIGCRCNKCAP